MKYLLDPDVKVLLPDGSTRRLMDFLLPSTLLMLAALLLVISVFLPYWRMTMFAPQYPKGLRVEVFVNRLEGDVAEVDALNHYLGMPPLDEGGRLVLPVGPRDRQQLTVVAREGDRVVRRELEPAVFVPLLGRYGQDGGQGG